VGHQTFTLSINYHGLLILAGALFHQDDTVVVADFGLARSVAVRNRSFVAADGQTLSTKRRLFRRQKCKTIVGNPYWMAPEMIHGLTYDEKVDVFSFGMIVCEVNRHCSFNHCHAHILHFTPLHLQGGLLSHSTKAT